MRYTCSFIPRPPTTQRFVATIQKTKKQAREQGYYTWQGAFQAPFRQTDCGCSNKTNTLDKHFTESVY